MSSKGPPGLFIAAGSSKDNCNGKNKRIDRSAFAPLLKACRFRQSGLHSRPCHYLIGDHLVERASQAAVIMGAHFVIHQPVHHVPTFSLIFCHAHKIGMSCFNSDILAHDFLLCVGRFTWYFLFASFCPSNALLSDYIA
jgi:hypothetical protein